MPPGFLATAFRDRGNTGVFLECIGCGVACTLFPKGAEEAGGQDRPSAWQGVKQGEVGMALGGRGDSFLDVCAPLQGDTEWGNEGLPQEGIGSEDAIIGGQGCGTLDGLEAGGDEGGRAHVVCTEEGRKGGAACELGRFEGGQRRRKSQKSGVSFSSTHRRACGK